MANSTKQNGRWNCLSDGNPSGTALIAEAGRAAGVEGLKIDDFRYIHRHYIVPALITLNPHQAAPAADVPPVLLGSLETPPLVLGIEIKDPRLSEEEYDCLAVLRKYYPNRVELPRLKEKTNLARPDRILQRLEGKHELWPKVLDVWPSKREPRGGGYGFKRP